jgi:hypothetical protein
MLQHLVAGEALGFLKAGIEYGFIGESNNETFWQQE